MSRKLLPPVVLLAVLAIACGGSSRSVFSPSPLATGGSSTSGATITGNVRFGATAPILASEASQGMTVTIVGTTISATVGATGQFVLTGVPPGSVQLRFQASGVDGTVTVSNVSDNETITISVAVSGTTAVIETEFRSRSGEEQLEGRIESLPPTQPAGTLVVAGRTVNTDASTQIRQGGTLKSFADLEIGMRVHVKGTSDGTALLARVIEIQNTNTDIGVQINGIVENLTGDELAYEFEVNGRLIKGDFNTTFFGDGNHSSSFADLENGVRVEVKGQQKDAHVYAVRIHVNCNEDDDEDDGGDQDRSASIEGTLKSMSGTPPNLVLDLGGTTVRTDADTRVDRRGDKQSLSALAIGQTLHVVGDRKSDGSIDARKIQIKDDEEGGGFEIEGSIGGLTGTCPSVTFTINGYSIFTDSSTKFEGVSCSGLKSGTKVEVEGVRQADGRVRATTVEK